MQIIAHEMEYRGPEVTSALQLRLQAQGIGIPSQLLLMLPYFMTIVALIFASKNAEFPSAYTIPYSRMER